MRKKKIEFSSVEFRVFLQQDLLERTRNNPSYSLRAFARFLNVEPSRLSKILSGKRPVSPELLQKMGQRLGLTLGQIEELKIALPERWKKRKPETSAESHRNSYQQLSLDTFEIVSDWHHYAILELLKMKGFSTDTKWIASKLGISSRKVNYFVERLVRVGLLSISPDGTWKDLSEGFSTHVLGDNYTSYAHKKAQADILQMALKALWDIPIERRDQSSTMISTNIKKIQEAKKKIKEFRLQLCDFLEDSKEKDSIVQLSVSLFPLVENQE